MTGFSLVNGVEMMIGGDELTECTVYDAAAYDDDFPCESEIDDCLDDHDGCHVIGPFTALLFAADFLAINTSRQR